MQISYTHGLEVWIARWNYIDESSWAYCVFDLGGKYRSLFGKGVLIDSYNTTNFDTTLEFIGDGKLIKSYHLTPNTIPFDIGIDVTGIKQLKVYAYDNKAVSGGTSFGLTRMELSINTEIKPLTEIQLKNKVSSYGTIIDWAFYDYDGNGIEEAFFTIGDEDNDGYGNRIYAVCYIDSEGNISLLRNEFWGIFYQYNNIAESKVRNRRFFAISTYNGGYGSVPYIYTVEKGSAFELNTDGDYSGFYVRDGDLYAYIYSHKNGGLGADEYKMNYNENDKKVEAE